MEVKNEYVPDVVSSPGETLRERLEERDILQADLAKYSGLSEECVDDIINARVLIDSQTALALEGVLGAPASFWESREKRYREYITDLEMQNVTEARSL